MTKTSYFMLDPSDVHQRLRYNAHAHLRDLSDETKSLCLSMIQHQLNTNGYQTNVFKQIPNLDGYAAQLLHEMCVCKQRAGFLLTALDIDR
eukprot:CAMPEP_0202700802 /NCGR_PEP_ID=MMETSP1385-20130828/13962_1 /ASSEMBLY_ACC=CAM_ASM_000861 /TAXON_ID=933848 /ORGANISM="Elphidium margaritaceum" /LENGTH=90 /DNA_ID=CAMNT_0049358071 /DNA_START=84 /DNA_END=352 /DNA_ORIENTATION=-